VSLPAPGILQETMVPVVANDQCNTLLGSGSVTSNMMCAGLMEGGKDTCQVQQPTGVLHVYIKHAVYLKFHWVLVIYFSKKNSLSIGRLWKYI